MGRGYDSFHRRLYFFNYYISPPPAPFFCSKGCKHPFTNLSVFLSCCRGTKEGVGICFMVFTRKLFPFFFPPPPPPFPSSDSSVVDVRGSSKPRRICKLFFLSLLNRFDKGGEKRGEEGGSDGCCGKEGRKEGTKLINTIEEEYERREARAAQ